MREIRLDYRFQFLLVNLISITLLIKLQKQCQTEVSRPVLRKRNENVHIQGCSPIFHFFFYFFFIFFIFPIFVPAHLALIPHALV